MFQTRKAGTPRAEAGRLAIAVVIVAGLAVLLQLAFAVAFVGRPLERAVVALREPAPTTLLLQRPSYVEEIEVAGPPRWQRDLARATARARDPLPWTPVVEVADAAALVCPASAGR